MTMRLRMLAAVLVIVPIAATVGPAGARPDPGLSVTAVGAIAPRVDRHARAAALRSRTPVAVAPVGGRVLRPFIPPATRFGRGHRGVDLEASPGEPVRAALPGTVRYAGHVAGVTWLTVEHADGLLTTYGGFVATVRAGDRVDLGAPLGRAGRRGRLDWGARRNGAYIDPLALLGTGRIRLVPLAAR
jgi:murein DD-endopeptidase MepM/ murein hydrolase activator NlpD